MQWIWLLPSLGYGIYTFITTGQPTGLIFGGLSSFAVLAGMVMAGRREPVDLKAPVRFSPDSGAGSRVAIGNRVLPKFEWLWQPAWVGRVYQELEVQNTQRNASIKLAHRVEGSLASSAPGLSAWLGFSGLDQVNVDLANDGAHALIVGSTGTGKSQLLTCWLVSLADRFTPEHLSLWLLDFKGGATFRALAATPWAREYATDLDGGATDLLANLLLELERREQICADHQVSRLEDLEENVRPPILILAIDESQQLLADVQVHAPLQSVASRGRSLGMHLILTSQSMAGIPRALMANLGIRVAVGKADPVDLAQLGYQRQSAVSDANPATQNSTVPSTASGWGSAVLISQSQQISFAFPSRGKVGFERLLLLPEEGDKNVFSSASAPFGHQNAETPSDSVVVPKNTFDFSIGIEKQL